MNGADTLDGNRNDDAEAIDKSNILRSGRTRGAKPEGGYAEPGDEEGLPGWRMGLLLFARWMRGCSRKSHQRIVRWKGSYYSISGLFGL